MSVLQKGNKVGVANIVINKTSGASYSTDQTFQYMGDDITFKFISLFNKNANLIPNTCITYLHNFSNTSESFHVFIKCIN